MKPLRRVAGAGRRLGSVGGARGWRMGDHALRSRIGSGELGCRARHLGFVARIAGGRGRVGAHAPGAAFVLRQQNRRATLHVVRRSIHFALQLMARSSVATAAPRQRPAMAPEAAAPAAVELRHQRIVHERARQLLVIREQRMPASPSVTRWQSLSRFVALRTVQRARIEAPAVGAVPPARIVVRGPAGGGAAKELAPRQPGSQEPWPSPTDAMRARPPDPRSTTTATLPPQELSRVTDHVIERLELRARSLRERFGQI